MGIRYAGNKRIRNVLDGVGATRVLRRRDVVVVWNAVPRVKHDIFKDRTETDSVVDLGFLGEEDRRIDKHLSWKCT